MLLKGTKCEWETEAKTVTLYFLKSLIFNNLCNCRVTFIYFRFHNYLKLGKFVEKGCMKYQYIISFFLCSLILSCAEDNCSQLEIAEALMQDRPDSSLSLILQMEPERIHNAAIKARYALLLTMASDKNNIDVADDSLINFAVDYYSLHGDAAAKMKTWYYHGIVQKNAGDYSSAVVSFEKAEQYAKSIYDLHFLGLIYRNKTEVFTATNNIPLAIEHAKLSLSAFLENGEKKYADYARYSLAVSYLNNLDIASAREQLNTLMAADIPQSLIDQARLCQAESYVIKEDSLARALEIYERTQEKWMTSRDFGLCALAYALDGQSDQMQKMLMTADSVAKTPLERANTGFLLAKIDSLSGNYKTAYTRVKKAAVVQDSLTRVLLKQSLIMSQRDYYKQEVILRENMMKQQKTVMVFGAIVAILILLVSGIIVIYRRKKRDFIIKEQMAELTLAQQTMQKNNANLIGALFFEKITHLCALSGAYYSANDSEIRKTYFSQFKRGLRDLSSTDFFNGLEQDINHYCSGLIDKLRTQIPAMSESHRQMLMLFFTGVPEELIMLITHRISVGSLKTFRTRLRNEIKQAHASDEQLFLDMLVVERQIRKK